ncbi:uncharacterized protein BDW43DRAFT_277127 [Aspergillus alliaceus]|uniref:uncharacterized protein n=1 Tax=Petromyces alliaceus TaxID=209559 RepID=UPI0012A54AAC|nr:uncharacterized protein BDW43DRAFT_277127 [Aspergillus alliaceus]KAB8233034.1 hypothetical protein BDW43DRAFT_277127 [Aspergillus alliaceus]
MIGGFIFLINVRAWSGALGCLSVIVMKPPVSNSGMFKTIELRNMRLYLSGFGNIDSLGPFRCIGRMEVFRRLGFAPITTRSWVA